MKSDPEKDALDQGIHQKSFDQQSSNTKELELLAEKVEKTTGQEINTLHALIRIKSGEVPSLKPELESISVPPLKNTSS